MTQQRQYSTQDLFTQENQKKFFLCLKQKAKIVLILLIILTNTAM